MKTSQQYALVTGATSGIGLELAKLLAKDGYNLVIVARNAAGTSAGSEMICKKHLMLMWFQFPKIFLKKKRAFELYDAVKEKELQINVLVNDAGQGQYGEFVDTDIDREMDIIQLNIISLVVLTKFFFRDMVDRGMEKY